MDLFSTLLMLFVLIFSAILHEIAHGFVAERLGDPTARLSGRLTLNPIKHIDPIMTIALPLILLISNSPFIFGGAKPVPVDPFNLRDGRKDLALVSLAGPLTNILLAIAASLIIKLIFLSPDTAIMIAGEGVIGFFLLFLKIVVQLNLLLAVFNLLPIPPLDGSKVFSLLLPEKTANAYLSLGSIGIFIIFFLLFAPGELSLGNFIYSIVSFSQKILLGI